VNDLGTYSADSVDYPDFAHKVAEAVESGAVQLGVLLCGSANGVAMSANKHADVRAAICWTPEIASLARQHNDANICCLPARFVSTEELQSILKAYFDAEFEGGRHARRVGKIACV
jgi:ribose 5-phosphate isomerase B